MGGNLDVALNENFDYFDNKNIKKNNNYFHIYNGHKNDIPFMLYIGDKYLKYVCMHYDRTLEAAFWG